MTKNSSWPEKTAKPNAKTSASTPLTRRPIFPIDAEPLQLDLGAPAPLEEIRLYAARPNDFPPRNGFGFPIRFRVETSNEPDFSRPLTLFSTEDRDFLNPGENPVVIPADGATGRFLRVMATKLWPRVHDYIFALGEMEVYSGGRNIAPRAAVLASDDLEAGAWSERWLNDGFTSQGRLLNLATWLRGLSRRRGLESELAALDRAQPELLAEAWRRLARWGVASVAVGIAAVGAAIWRQRLQQRRELAGLRRQIAADLHDEIGSNLGSIALLARLGAAAEPSEARDDLGDIQRIAEETAESMRDIVWLIAPGQRDAAALVEHFREIARRLLAEIEHRFTINSVTGPFSLERERNLILFYREALNNIRKHARARAVAIDCSQADGRFLMRIADDGCGFDERTIKLGNGLPSLRQRAERLKGELKLTSAPGSGTVLELRLPLP